jgi:GTP-binding protein
MIKKSLFIKSVNNYKFAPLPKLPEIVLVGRSNVGKSSFINALTNNNKLSFISKKPGKTINLNYFLLNESFYLVDSPGYGFSKRNKKIQNNIKTMIQNFFKKNFFIKIIFQLIDFKIGPTELDLKTYKKLISYNFFVVIIFNKKDKISKNKILIKMEQIKKNFNLFNLNIPEYYLLSCLNKEGLDDIFNLIKYKIK